MDIEKINIVSGPDATATQPQLPVPRAQMAVQKINNIGGSILTNAEKFAHMQRVSNLFAASSLVPSHFAGNMPDCFVAANLAERLGVDIFALMQNIYVVHGRPALTGQMITALINKSGLFSTLQFSFFGSGENLECKCFAMKKAEGIELSQTVSWRDVKKNGWDKEKKGMKSKWETLPKLMFQYRAATWFGRVHCPEVLFGLKSVEEVEDIEGVQIVEAVAEIEPASVPEIENAKGIKPVDDNNTDKIKKDNDINNTEKPKKEKKEDNNTNQIACDDELVGYSGDKEIWQTALPLNVDKPQEEKKEEKAKRARTKKAKKEDDNGWELEPDKVPKDKKQDKPPKLLTKTEFSTRLVTLKRSFYGRGGAEDYNRIVNNMEVPDIVNTLLAPEQQAELIARLGDSLDKIKVNPIYANNNRNVLV
jgi:hypothetical protein